MILMSAIGQMVPMDSSAGTGGFFSDINDDPQSNRDQVSDIIDRLAAMTAQPEPDLFAVDDVAVLAPPAQIPVTNPTVISVAPAVSPSSDVSVARANTEPEVVVESPAPSENTSGNSRNNQPADKPESRPQDEPEVESEDASRNTPGGLLRYDTVFDGTLKGNFAGTRVSTGRTESSNQAE